MNNKILQFADIFLRPFQNDETKRLLISLTNRCNYQCKHCNIWRVYQDHVDSLAEELAFKDYQKFFNIHNDLDIITFTGGEPFLRADLFEIAYTAWKMGKNLKVLAFETNGSSPHRINSVIGEILERTTIRKIQLFVSIDGVRQTHDSIYSVDGAFDNAIETVEQMAKTVDDHRIEVFIRYTISKYNQGQMKFFLRSNLVPTQQVLLNIARNSFRFYNEGDHVTVVPDSNELHKDIEYFLEHYQIRRKSNLIHLTFLQSVLQNKKIPCDGGVHSFFMDPYGTIYPCTQKSTKLGAINDKILTAAHDASGCSCYSMDESSLNVSTIASKSLIDAYISSSFSKKHE